MQRIQLLDYTAQLLQPERFRDYCPNGLQVEGAEEVRHIVTGVTACMDLLEAAHGVGADTILVHHGYFWRSEALPVVGIKKKRLQYLLAHNINLIAYHLPLDAHPELGNNAQLGKRMGLSMDCTAGELNLVAVGEYPHSLTLSALAQRIEHSLKRVPLCIGAANQAVRRVAWCTGGAQQAIQTAIELGVDVFISGEISEQTVHLARESGVAYIAAGHHATERYGVQALGHHLAERFGIQHTFIDIENPV